MGFFGAARECRGQKTFKELLKMDDDLLYEKPVVH